MTETFAEKFVRVAREVKEAREAYTAWRDEAVAAKYAEIRARDKAEGRDTSGKSVSGRRSVAYDSVVMSDEAFARRAAVDAAQAAVDEIRGRTIPR